MSSSVDSITVDSGVGKLSIPRFSGRESEWPVWKKQFSAIARIQGLMGVIDGGDSGNGRGGMGMGASTSSAAAKKVKKKTTSEDNDNNNENNNNNNNTVDEDTLNKQYRAYALLISSLSQNDVRRVMSVDDGDASGVWRALIDHYERKSIVSMAHLRRMMHKARMKEFRDFSLYFAYLNDIKARLNGMGEKVSDGEFVFAIFEGLGKEYAGVIQTLEVQDKLAVEEICTHIKNFEEKIKLKIIQEAESEYDQFSAYSYNNRRGNYGNRVQGGSHKSNSDDDHDRDDGSGNSVNNGNNNSDRDLRNWRCGLCRKLGHMTRDCPQRKGGPGACYKCGQVGHIIVDCDRVNNNKGRGNHKHQAHFSATNQEMEEDQAHNYLDHFSA